MATELSWDTKPDPNGLSETTQAEYMQGAISVLARQGVQGITFWNLRDDAELPAWDLTYQSGIFRRGASIEADTRKPSYTAFRFPFTANRAKRHVQLWGKAPASGIAITVQRLAGERWRKVTTVRPKADGVFEKRVTVARGTKLRAVQSTETSLTSTSR